MSQSALGEQKDLGLDWLEDEQEDKDGDVSSRKKYKFASTQKASPVEEDASSC
jgi:hypothetical protein